MTIVGLDISRWQSTITAATVAAMRAQGVRFCGVKVSQGSSYEDPQWRNSVQLLQAGGIIPYPYHFVTTDRADLQYSLFSRLISQVEWRLPPALDCEAYTATASGQVFSLRDLRNPLAQMSIIDSDYGYAYDGDSRTYMGERESDRLLAAVSPDGSQVWLGSIYTLTYPTEAIVDAIGRNLTTWMQARPALAPYQYPAIYTNASSGNVIFKSASMSRYPLWVANWNVTKPLLPTVWKGKTWYIWQDAVVAGEPYGIAGKVDHDVWGELFPFPVTPEPEPEPEPDPGQRTIHVEMKDSDGSEWSGTLYEVTQ